jgi:Fe-S-cluster-containing dehydrogenase component
MARKWNMIVDVSRCDNCRNCFLATKDEHIGNEFPGYAAPNVGITGSTFRERSAATTLLSRRTLCR